MAKLNGGNPPSRLPTMADVAKKVGVSRQLVSLVFRGGAGVNPETEVKIRTAAKEIGYRPNLAARSLRQDSSRYIGVVFHTSESSMDELLPALYKHAKRAGYDLMLSAVTTQRGEAEAIEEIIGHRCEGMVLISPQSPKSRLQRLARELPMVSIGRRLTGVRCGVVSSWGEKGVAEAVAHLVSLGHREIACVYAKDMNDGEFRLEGYLNGMHEAELRPDVVELEGDFGELGGARAAEKLLRRKTLPTAVVCNNDQSAFGFIHRLQQAGVAFPSEMSVVGYDDTLARWPFLSLTTVRQDGDELAAAAIFDLASRIRGEKFISETVLTSSKLVLRTSTTAPIR